MLISFCDENQFCLDCGSQNYLDLDSKTCVSNCRQEQTIGHSRKIKVINNQETSIYTNYCRGSKIFIDPDSRSYLELGTKAFPYKQIQPALKEIYENLPSAQNKSFEILIKSNSTLYFNSRLERHYLDGLYNLTIRTYQDLSDNIEILGQSSKIMISSSKKYYQHDSTYFSLMDANSQNLTASYHPQVSSEKELRSVASNSQAYFIVSRSNLTFQNLDIINEHTISNENDQFLYGIDIQYGKIILDRMTFDFAGSIFQTKDNLNFQLTNTIIRTEYLNYAIAILTDCSLRKSQSYATYGDILIQNTTIKGNRIFEQKMPLIWLVTNHNVTFDNNTMNTYTLNSDANLIHFILNSVDNCIVPVNDGRVKIQKFTNLLIDQETKERNIQNLYQVIFSKGGDKLRDMTYQVENITVQNLFTTNNLFQFATPLPNITISNIRFRNSTLKLKAGSFLNISSTTNIFLNNFEYVDSIHLGKGATFPQRARYLNITNFLIRNITQLYSSASHILMFRMQSLQIHNTTFSNFTYLDKFQQNSYVIKMISNDLFSNQLKQSVFKNILVENCAINFMLFQGFQANGVLNSTQRYFIDIVNVTITNSQVEKQNGLIVIDQFYNKLNTQIRIINSTFIDNNFVAGGYMIDFRHNDINPVIIYNSTFMNNANAQIFLRAWDLIDINNQLKVWIQKSQFYKNSPYVDGMIQVQTNSLLNVTDSIFEENYSISRGRGIFYMQYNGFLQIENSRISNNFAIFGGVGIVTDQAFAIIKNSSILNNLAIDSSILEINDAVDNLSVFSDLEIEGNKLISIQYVLKEGYFQVQLNSKFKNFLQRFISNNQKLNINGKKHVRNITDNYKYQFLVQIFHICPLKLKEELLKCFKELFNQSIHISLITWQLQEELFPYIAVNVNSYLLNYILAERCDYWIQNSSFQRNYAFDQGGAINYNKNTPRGLDQNTYIDNYAKYGNNMASIPFTIRIVSISKNDTISGQKFNGTIVVEVLDIHGQRITNDVTTDLKIASIDEKNTAVQGQTIAKAKYGIVEFKDLTFIGRPDSQNVSFRVYSTTINNDHLREIYNLSSDTIINQDVFYLNFRICLLGEVEVNSQCYPCEFISVSIQKHVFSKGFVMGHLHTYQVLKKQIFNALLDIVEIYVKLAKTMETFNMQASTNLLDLQWPDDLSGFFGTFTYVGDSVQNLIYFDCFLKNTSITEDGRSITYFKTILIGVIPIMLVIVFELGLYVCKVIKRAPKKVFIEWTIIMTVIVIYFTHPTVTRTIINIFYCLEIDSGQYWLQSDLSVKCWEGDHKSLSLIIGLPFLLIYVIGLPILTFLYLYKNRKLIFTPEYKNKFKTLCSGLKPEFYYWEFVNILRKIFLVFLNVFLQTEISIFKAMLSLLVLGIIYRLQVRLQPYEQKKINELEKLEMKTNLITFYGSLFFVNDEIQSWMKAVIFILIIGFNVLL
eukprot:403375796